MAYICVFLLQFLTLLSFIYFHTLLVTTLLYHRRYQIITNYAVSLKEADSFLRNNRYSANQEIPRVLWDLNTHYRIHKSTQSVPILSQINPLYVPLYQFFKICFNFTLPSTLESSMLPSSSGISTKILCAYLLSHTRATYPRQSNCSWFYHPNNIIKN